MGAESLVSVVIPAYQSADTLPRAVQSVLAQDYPHLEIIIVDNGSTDHTQQVIAGLMAQDQRVRMVHLTENRRPAGGRNAGVEHAAGGYVAFLDADDAWLPGKLTGQVRVLDDHPQAGIIVSDGWIVETATNVRQLYSDSYATYLARLTLTPLSDDVYWLDGPFRAVLYEKCFLNTSSVMLRRDLFLAHSGFDARFFGPEDMDLWVRLTKHTRFVYWAVPQVNRYISSTNLSAVSERWLLALLHYHKVCFFSPDYADLKSLAQQNIFKYYRMMVVYYGRRRSFQQAWKMVFESLRYGFDLRLPLYASLSPLGSPAYDVGEKWLGRFRKT